MLWLVFYLFHRHSDRRKILFQPLYPRTHTEELKAVFRMALLKKMHGLQCDAVGALGASVQDQYIHSRTPNARSSTARTFSFVGTPSISFSPATKNVGTK